MPDFPSGVAVVIGGSGGVGQAICQALAAAGSDVALTYRNNREAGEKVAAELQASGRRASAHALSVGDAAAVQTCLDAIAEQYGNIHTVVHAAGSNIDQPYISKITPEQWREVIDADVNGSFHVVHAALPHLRAEGGGSIVYLSSAGLTRFPPGDVLSVAPKGAVESLLRGVAREEGRYQVRANSVAIGVVDGGMFHRLLERGELDEQWVQAAKRNIALRRFGTLEEIANAVVFLASSRAGYITGQTLHLDGGYTV